MSKYTVWSCTRLHQALGLEKIVPYKIYGELVNRL